MYAGWVSFGRADDHRDLAPDTDSLLARLTPFHTPDRAGAIQLDRFTAVQAITFNTPESRDEAVPCVDPATGNVLVSWLRLDNRADLGRELDISGRDLRRLTDPDLVHAAYRRWGVDCANKLEGDFSFALWDKQRQSLYLARDSIGVKPLFYAEIDGAIAFATTAACFLDFPVVDTVPDPVWMARFIGQASESFTKTAFRGVAKLPPGHWMRVDYIGQRQVKRYHSFVDDAPWADERDPRWVGEYRAVLEESVRARLRSAYPHGAETSGGLDSSTIIGMMAHLEESQRRTMQTFGHALLPDEPRYILETSMYHRLGRNNILTRLDQADEAMVLRGARTLGYPVEHPDAIGYIPFFAMAQGSRIRTMHSGFGGDEVVTNPAGQLTSELLTRRRWLRALRELPGSKSARPMRLLKRMRSHYLSGVDTPIAQDWVRAHFAGRVLSDDALGSAGVSERWRSNSRFLDRYGSINECILADRLSHFVPTRTEQFSLIAGSYGIEYRWALLDRRLMQFYLSTPAVEKWGEGFGRYLHRRAVAGVVPDSIAWKASKSMGTLPPLATEESRFLPWSEIVPEVRDLLSRTRYLSWVDERGHPDRPESLPHAAWSSLVAVAKLNQWRADGC